MSFGMSLANEKPSIQAYITRRKITLDVCNPLLQAHYTSVLHCYKHIRRMEAILTSTLDGGEGTLKLKTSYLKTRTVIEP